MNPFVQAGWTPKPLFDIRSTPQQPTPPQAQPKKKKNFWLDQISTVGGIAGGIGGSLIAPFAGTAGGAAAGSGLGEAIENIISGDSITKNVGKEAALGGVFGAGPLRLLKGAGAGAKALATGADDVVGAASRAAMTPVRQQLGNRSLAAADRAITKQFKFSPSQLTNFTKRHGEDPTTLIKRYGINNADDIAVKAIEPLQSAFDDVVTKIPTISSKALGSSLKKVYNPLLKSANLSEQQLGNQLKAQADEIIAKSGQTISSAEVNTLRKSFDDFVKYTQRGTAEHNVNKMTADALRKTLQQAADGAGMGFQGKTFKEIGKDLSKLYDLDEIAGRQANLGRGSNPVNITNLLGMTAGGAGGGPAGMAAGALLTGAANSGTGRALARRGAESAGNRLIQSGTKSAAQAFTPRGIGTRIGGLAATRGVMNQEQPASLENTLLQSSFPNQENQAYMPNAATNNTTVQNMSQSSPFGGGMSSGGQTYSLENAILDIQRDPNNADYYMKFYEFANPQQENLKLNNTAVARISDYESGINALDGLEQSILGSGVNQPFLGDVRRRNPFDTEAQDLNSSIRSVRQLVGKALEGGVLRREDEVKYEQMLPKIGDTDATARAKIANVRKLLTSNLDSFMQNSQRFSGNPASLEDALIQQGGY